MTVVAAILVGAVAALLRWRISLAFSERSLPWAVLTVNVVASAVGGIALGLVVVGAIDDSIRLVLLSGIAGGLSTFSTWSVESIQLVQAGRWRVAVASVAANLVLGIAAATAGYLVIAAFLG